MRVIVRPVHPDDRDEWNALYAGYARFYRVEQSPDMRDRVWSWLHDEANPVRGIVAVRDAPGGVPDAPGADARAGTRGLVGIAHFRPFHRPLSASVGCYLDDLFVTHAARRSAAASLLLQEVGRIAADEGWTVIRGITRENNYRARVMYDRFAERTNWVTYDATPPHAS